MASNDTIKCVIVGDSSVGKKEILYSLVPSDQTQGRKSEKIVFDNKEIEIKVRNRSYMCSFVCPNGQEEFDRMRPLLYQGTDIFIIAFSIGDPISFENVKNKWYLEISNFAPNSEPLPFILLGTKSDLRTTTGSSSPRQLVSKAEAVELCSNLKGICYHECSATTNKGINDILKIVGNHIHSKRDPSDTGSCCTIM
jgi:small GTP-binding protein